MLQVWENMETGINSTEQAGKEKAISSCLPVLFFYVLLRYIRKFLLLPVKEAFSMITLVQ